MFGGLVLHIVSAEDAAKRQEHVGKDVGKDVEKELTERQLVIIELIEQDPYISAQKMSDKEMVAARTVERDLAQLKDLGVLSRMGGTKGWILEDKQRAAPINLRPINLLY
ncbi:MAG: HTH domain-containing protein [Bacteroidales bacterium]|nr:HTH domain-containing protein [Bacteroidales bacterium]